MRERSDMRSLIFLITEKKAVIHHSIQNFLKKRLYVLSLYHFLLLICEISL